MNSNHSIKRISLDMPRGMHGPGNFTEFKHQRKPALNYITWKQTRWNRMIFSKNKTKE